MNDVVTWAALIAGISACIGIAKFWLDRGKAEAKAQSAEAIATAAHGKCEILGTQLSNFQIEVARNYASNEALSAAERQMTEAVSGVREEIRGLNERLDRFLQAMIPRREP